MGASGHEAAATASSRAQRLPHGCTDAGRDAGIPGIGGQVRRRWRRAAGAAAGWLVLSWLSALAPEAAGAASAYFIHFDVQTPVYVAEPATITGTSKNCSGSISLSFIDRSGRAVSSREFPVRDGAFTVPLPAPVDEGAYTVGGWCGIAEGQPPDESHPVTVVRHAPSIELSTARLTEAGQSFVVTARYVVCDQTVSATFDDVALTPPLEGKEPLRSAAVSLPAGVPNGDHRVGVSCLEENIVDTAVRVAIPLVGAGAGGQTVTSPPTRTPTPTPTPTPTASTPTADATSSTPAPSESTPSGTKTPTPTGTRAAPDAAEVAPRSPWATSLTSLSSFDPFGLRDVALVAALAAMVSVAAFLVAFPAEVFDSTLEENYARLMRPVDRLRALVGRFVPAVIRHRVVSPVPVQVKTVAFLSVVLVLATIADPSFGDNEDMRLFVAGLVLATPVTLLAFELPFASSCRRSGASAGRFGVLGGALLVAAGFSLLSWRLDLQPGYVYGLVAGYLSVPTYAERARERALRASVPAPSLDGAGGGDAVAAVEQSGSNQQTGEARAVLVGTAALAATMLAAALALVGLTVLPGDWPGRSEPAQLVDAALAALVILASQSMAFRLLPLPFMDGLAVLRWRPLRWVVVMVPAWATVLLTTWWPALHRDAEPPTHAEATKAELVFIIVGLGSLAFLAFMWWRRHRGQGLSGRHWELQAVSAVKAAGAARAARAAKAARAAAAVAADETVGTVGTVGTAETAETAGTRAGPLVDEGGVVTAATSVTEQAAAPTAPPILAVRTMAVHASGAAAATPLPPGAPSEEALQVDAARLRPPHPRLAGPKPARLPDVMASPTAENAGLDITDPGRARVDTGQAPSMSTQGGAADETPTSPEPATSTADGSAMSPSEVGAGASAPAPVEADQPVPQQREGGAPTPVDDAVGTHSAGAPDGPPVEDRQF